MGGLARFMPITALTMLIATLSISGIPPFSGFWSKDPIIASAYEYGMANGSYWLYGMTAFTAFLTAFYMFRLYFMTFGGRGGAFGGLLGRQRQYRGEGQPTRGAVDDVAAAGILAVPTVLLGFWSINSGFADYLTGEQIPYASPFSEIADLYRHRGRGGGHRRWRG